MKRRALSKYPFVFLGARAFFSTMSRGASAGMTVKETTSEASRAEVMTTARGR